MEADLKVGKLKARICSFGSSFPSRVVPNSELEERLGLPQGWIFERVGISERRFVSDGEQNSELAVQASLDAIRKSGLKAEGLDLILGCTNSPDRWMPGLAPTVQAALKIKGAAAYDIVTACAGWIAGLDVARAFIQAGLYKNVLVIGSEAQSRFLNLDDPVTAVIFGDGAGACVVGTCEESDAGSIIDILIHTDGAERGILTIPGGGTETPASRAVVSEKIFCMQMDGEKVFLHAVRKLVSACKEILQKNNISVSDLDWFVPHQANRWIIEMVGEGIGIESDKIAVNIESYGNTTAATIPTCFNEYVENGKIKRGDLVLFATFGAGLTWGAGLIRW